MSAAALALVPTSLPPVPVTEAERENLQELWEARKAANTRRAYASDWKEFQRWAFVAGVQPMPAAPETIARYLGSLSGIKAPSTIGRRATGIGFFHVERGLPDPTRHQLIKGILQGIRRKNAGHPIGQAAPVLTKHLRRAFKAEPKKPAGYRDRAMMLLGFAGGFRRSELVALNCEDLQFDDEGRLRVTLRRSKTNQEGKPEYKHFSPAGHLCPIKALRAWLAIAGITTGAVFRSTDRHGNIGPRISHELVNLAVKRLAKAAGLNAAEYSAHSLRAGLVTQAFQNEVPIEIIQAQTGHRDINTLLRYRRDVDACNRNVTSSLGL